MKDGKKEKRTQVKVGWWEERQETQESWKREGSKEGWREEMKPTTEGMKEGRKKESNLS